MGSEYIGGEHSDSSAGVLGGTGRPPFRPGRGTPSVGTDGYLSLFLCLCSIMPFLPISLGDFPRSLQPDISFA